jgi:hypothetical protein
MKNKLILILFSAAILMVLPSMTFSKLPPNSPDFTVEITAKNDLKVQVIGLNKTGKKLTITLSKTENVMFGYYAQSVVYTEKIAANIKDVNRTLDLSKLENGHYEVIIKAGRKQITKSFDIETKPTEVTAPRVISIN